jgi:hypothetical protein
LIGVKRLSPPLSPKLDPEQAHLFPARMATLTRPKPGTTQQSELDSTDSTTDVVADTTGVDLTSTVPTPFPQIRRVRANSASSQRIQNTATNVNGSQIRADFQENSEQIASVVQSEDSHTEQVSRYLPFLYLVSRMDT